MTSIAQAYVEILPSARGMQGALSRELGGVEAGLSQSTRRGFLGGFAGVSSAIVGAVGVAGLATAGAAIGATLSRGLTRALNIQDARAQLTGLGHDVAGIDAIMENALTAVRGTAFGLDEAATTAASAVAAGIDPGQELASYLTLVADTAAITGDSLADIGSVLNNVQTVGAAYNDSLQILAQKGIPIYSLLADAMGVSTAEVKELASQGAITADVLNDALAGAVGGAAQAAGDTARGALANVGAAIGRVGAMFVGGAVGAAPTLFQSIAGAIDRVGAALEPVAEGLGSAMGPAIESLAGWIDSIDFTALGAGGAAFSAVGTAVAPLLSAFLQLWQALSPVSILFQALAPHLPVVASLLGQIASVVASVLATALSALAPLIGLVVEALSMIFAAVLPLVPALLQLISPLLMLIGSILPPLIGLFTAVLGPVLEFAVLIINLLMPVIMGLVEVLSGLINFVTGVFTGNWALAWAGIQQMFQGFVDAVGALINGGLYVLLEGIPNFVMSVFSGIGDWLVGSGESLIQGFIDGITGMIGAVGDAIGGVMDFVAGFFPNSPAKHGPLSGSGWRALGKSGGAIEDAFASGFTGRIDDVLTSGVQVPRVPVSAEVASYAAGRGGSPVNVTIETSQALDEYLVADVAANALARVLR